MLELLDSGLIYRNPQPFRKSIHAWHPTLALLDNGDLMAAYDLAEAIGSVEIVSQYRLGASQRSTSFTSIPLRRA